MTSRVAVSGRVAAAARVANPSIYNLVTQANNFNHADWAVKQNITITTGAGGQAGPGGDEGPSTCDSIVESTSTNVLHQLGQTTAGWTVGTSYVFAIWVKAAVRAFVAIQANSVGLGEPAGGGVYDLTTGISSTVPNSPLSNRAVVGMIAYPNGWWRCWFAKKYCAAGSFTGLVQAKNDGTLVANQAYLGTAGTVALYIAGAQVTVGPGAPPRYVGTTTTALAGSAALRAATAGRVLL